MIPRAYRIGQFGRLVVVALAMVYLTYLTWNDGSLRLGPANGGRPPLRCHDLYMPNVSEPYAYTCERRW